MYSNEARGSTKRGRATMGIPQAGESPEMSSHDACLGGDAPLGAAGRHGGYGIGRWPCGNTAPWLSRFGFWGPLPSGRGSEVALVRRLQRLRLGMEVSLWTENW